MKGKQYFFGSLQVDNLVLSMRRRDLGDNVVEIEHTDGSERWLVIKKMLDASKISLQAKSGAEVESTEIALAFPLQARVQKGTLQVWRTIKKWVER